MRFRQVLGISAIGGVAVAGLLAVRRWQLRWGATGQEAGGCLPGDDIIGNPDLTATARSPLALLPLRYGRGSSSSGKGGAGSTAMTSWKTWPAATFTARIGSCQHGKTSAPATRSGSPRRSLSPWPWWSRGSPLFCAVATRRGMPHLRTTSPGLSCSKRRRAGQRGYSCGRDMPSCGRGPGSWSSLWRRSAS